MTRVLHVLDHSLPMHSGYTFRTRAILKAQQAHGIEVRGITGLRHLAGGPTPEEAEGLLFHRTRGQAKGPAGLREYREVSRLSAAIMQLARDWRPDILHAHSPALCGMAALRAGRALGIPVVYECAVPFRGVGTRFLHVVYTPETDDRRNVTGWIASIRFDSASVILTSVLRFGSCRISG